MPIELYPNGSCWSDTNAMCESDGTDHIEVSRCNPPPPQRVTCPAGAPDPDDEP